MCKSDKKKRFYCDNKSPPRIEYKNLRALVQCSQVPCRNYCKISESIKIIRIYSRIQSVDGNRLPNQKIPRFLFFFTAQKMKFSVKIFFTKTEQIHGKLRSCSHLLKQSLTENFIFCAVRLLITNSSEICNYPSPFEYRPESYSQSRI